MRMAGELCFHQEEWEIEEPNAVRVSALSNLEISHWGWEGALWLMGGQSTYLYIETKDSPRPPLPIGVLDTWNSGKLSLLKLSFYFIPSLTRWATIPVNNPGTLDL